MIYIIGEDFELKKIILSSLTNKQLNNLKVNLPFMVYNEVMRLERKEKKTTI